MLVKYDCHINVEVCTSIKAVKYLYKYIHKTSADKKRTQSRKALERTNRGVEEMSAAMMRVEAIRRKQRLKEKQRKKKLEGSMLGNREKNIEKHFGSYSRATVNRKVLRRLSYSSRA